MRHTATHPMDRVHRAPTLADLPWCGACDHRPSDHDGDTPAPDGACDCGCRTYTEEQP